MFTDIEVNIGMTSHLLMYCCCLLYVYTSDRAMEKQAMHLKDVSDRYERDKKFWVTSVNDLEGKIKVKMHGSYETCSLKNHYLIMVKNGSQ